MLGMPPDEAAYVEGNDVLIIRHATGPLAGKEQKIEAQSDRITIGRDPDACDVVFPPDATIVARRHFALARKPSGEWTYDLFGDHYVAVNGTPADTGTAVHSKDKVELGQPGGPSFTIELEKEGLQDQLPVTGAQFKVEGAHAAAERSRVAASRAGRFGMIGLVVALLAVGVAGAFWYTTRSDAARLGELAADLTKRQAEIVAQTIPDAVRQKLLDAAFLVMKITPTGRQFGSASPIGPDTLATNAHVAAMFDELKPDERMFVRSPGPNGREYAVIGAVKHPGYEAFQKFLAQDQFYVDDFRLSGGDIGDYDVAILKVAPGSNLGPILELASPAELVALKPGSPLAMAGYPAEGITGAEVQARGATPIYSVGMVTALTDMFMMPADPAHRHLVHHNLPATGGSSGSPMVGPDGKIAAFLNSGNLFSIPGVRERIPNAVLINHAQRSDLLADLKDGRADAALATDRDYWAKQTATFKRGIELIVPQLLAVTKSDQSNRIPPGASPTLVNEKKFQLVKEDNYPIKQTKKDDKSGREVEVTIKKRQKIHPIKLTAGKPVAFVAYAQDKQPIELYLVIDNQIVRQVVANRWFGILPYVADKDMDAAIYVVGPDEDVNYTFFQYDWSAPPS
jgi:Trypsin-like peptidase domain